MDEKELEAIHLLLNNAPQRDFLGLSRNEMHRLLYETFHPDSPVQLATTISDDTMDSVPFFRLTEAFIGIVQQEGHLKLTPRGALPKKIVAELYGPGFIREKFIEAGLYKLSSEDRSLAISAMHHNTILSGLMRKAKGKLTVTKQTEKLTRKELFEKVLRSYTEKFWWGFADGYPSKFAGNFGWSFTIYMLLQEGNTPRSAGYYASRYAIAFPQLLVDFERDPSPYCTPQDSLMRCYAVRAFDRFLAWWGFVSSTGSSSEPINEIHTPTKALTSLFRLQV